MKHSHFDKRDSILTHVLFILNYQVIQIKLLIFIMNYHMENMLVQLFSGNYATLDDLVNGLNGTFNLRSQKYFSKIVNLDKISQSSSWIQHKN